MSDNLSPLRPLHSLDAGVIMENLQARLRETVPVRQTEELSSPAVTVQVRPVPKLPDDAEAAAGVSRIQAEAQRGVDVTAVHNGLDPQRVAKLLGLLE